MYIDLQTQTYFSDGQLSPAQLVRLAVRHGFRYIAITDHDSVGGIAAAQRAAKKCPITIIPGIELYSNFRGKELHVLGLDIDPRYPPLLRFLNDIQTKHRMWRDRVLELLEEDGWDVHRTTILRSRSELLGFAELLAILLRSKKNFHRVQQDLDTPTPDLFAMIERYFLRGGVAYEPLPEKSLPTARAIQLIHAAGGKAVLAHPGQTLAFADDRCITLLQQRGLDGIEAITPNHTWHQMLHYQRLARSLHLFVTAGSDFHESLRRPYYVQRTRWDSFHPSLPKFPWKRQ